MNGEIISVTVLCDSLDDAQQDMVEYVEKGWVVTLHGMDGKVITDPVAFIEDDETAPVYILAREPEYARPGNAAMLEAVPA